MLKLGEEQELIIEKKVPMGVYLAEEAVWMKEQSPAGGSRSRRLSANGRHGEEREKDNKGIQTETEPYEHVLLPRNQVPEDSQTGDRLRVFLYRDSEDRLIATRKHPSLKLHEVGWLTVTDTGRIGTFLDWGLDKDLLLPFHEQTGRHQLQKGEKVLCAVYIDKSGRLAATMNVYPWLRTDSPYQKGDAVTGTVYETSSNFGRFVAVDDIYSALIPKKELVTDLTVGEKVTARVAAVRPDGKLDLKLRAPVMEQMEKDEQIILARLEENGGRLNFTDKADPETIRKQMQMSKAQFKRAVGHLLKQRAITILPDAIVRNEQN